MATFVLYDEFGSDLGKARHNLSSDSLYLMLSDALTGNAVQTLGTVRADITQITGTNGYTTNGTVCGSITWAETGANSGIWQLTTADVVWTASGGSIAQFRYVMQYNFTNSTASYPLIGYLDYGSEVNVTVGNTFTVDVGASGWFQLTIP